MKNQLQTMRNMWLIMRDYRKFSYILILTFLLFSCSKEGKLHKKVYNGEALGTTYHISLFSENKFEMEEGLDSIFKVINRSMSTYINDSDISRINNGDSSIVVDDNFVQVFKTSKQIYKESNGYFDPTVGNLVNLYGFGPNHINSNINEREIDSMMQYVGFNMVALTPENKIRKAVPEIFLDFNAIAKGYTIDVIAQFLDAKKVENYLIELGGELLGKGNNLDRDKPWIVAIDDPRQSSENRTFQTTLQLNNRAMATSGNYRKFRTDSDTGNAYVHTINPLTGSSEKSNLLSASVLAPNCTLADGYATAFMALGLDKAKELAERLKEVDVYFIYSDENNSENIYATEGFKKILVEN